MNSAGADTVLPFSRGIKFRVEREGNTSDGSTVSAITTVDVTDYAKLSWTIATGDGSGKLYLLRNSAITDLQNSASAGQSGIYDLSNISGKIGIACRTYKTTLSADITIN